MSSDDWSEQYKRATFLEATSASSFLSSAYNFSGMRFVYAKEYFANATYNCRIGGASLGETCAHGNRHCDISHR